MREGLESDSERKARKGNRTKTDEVPNREVLKRLNTEPEIISRKEELSVSNI